MTRKTGYRFSGKVMLNSKWQFRPVDGAKRFAARARPNCATPGKWSIGGPEGIREDSTVALSEVYYFRRGGGDPDARHFAIGAVHGAVQREQHDGARGFPGLGQRHYVP